MTSSVYVHFLWVATWSSYFHCADHTSRKLLAVRKSEGRKETFLWTEEVYTNRTPAICPFHNHLSMIMRPGHFPIHTDAPQIDIYKGQSPAPSHMPHLNYPAFYSLLHFCHQFIIPVMIITGIIGNILTFLVFVFSTLKRLSTSVYLAALALADSCFLASLGASWLDNFRFSFFQQELVCTCVVYITYIFSFLSVWFVVCFTTDMYLTLFHEDLATKISQPCKARFVVCGLTLFSGIIYLHTFWTTKQVQTIHGRKTCAFVADKEIRMALALTDSLLTLLLPFSLLIFMNTRILLVIVGFSKGREVKHDDLMEAKDTAAKDDVEGFESTRDGDLLTTKGDEEEEEEGRVGEVKAESGNANARVADSSTNTGSLHNNTRSLVFTADEAAISENGNNLNHTAKTTSSRSAVPAKGASTRSCGRQQIRVLAPHQADCSTGVTLQKDDYRHLYGQSVSKQEMEELGSSYDFDRDDEFGIDLYIKKPKTMQGKISEMQRKSFKMLVTVAIVFLLLNLPSHVIRLQGLLRSVITHNYVTSEMEHLCQQLFQVFYYFNFMANFVIYNVCAKSFRTAFFTLPLTFSKACTCRESKTKHAKSKHTLTSRRLGQKLRRMREEQNSRLVEVNLAELHISKMESFASDFKYESPPCLLKMSRSSDENKV